MKALNLRNTFLAVAGIFTLLISTGISGAQTLGEALNATNLVWTTGGDVPWFVESTNTYNGNTAAAQSGVILSNQTSWLQTTVVGPATIDFWICFQPADNLGTLIWNFAINNPHPLIVIGAPEFYIPGITAPWNESIYDLGAGTNILRWTAYGVNAGSTSSFVAVDQFTVLPPRPLTIEYQPYGSTNYSGATAFFSVSAIGTPPIQYQWYVNGTNITGATNSSFLINNVSTNDSGIYSVLVTNSQGSIFSSNATLAVLPPSPPFFTSEPADTVAYTGQSLYINGGVDGSPPFHFQWYQNGTNPLTGGNSLYSTYFLSFNYVSLSNAGIYSVTITNLYGSISSTNFALTVVQSIAPSITNQPRSLDVAAGVNTWMNVGATGLPVPSYAWTDASLPPPPNEFPFPLFPGYGGNYSFNNVTAAAAGIYYATASNYGGQAVSQQALLTVLPSITNVATWNLDAVDIFVTNGLAFLARGTNGLAILNVANPASPQLVGTLGTSGYFNTITVSGNLAFVADEWDGLKIIGVSNPANPVLIGGYPLSDGAGQIVVRSNLVYVADGFAGLVVLDASNPASPSLVGSYAGDFVAGGVSLLGNYAVFGAPYPVTTFPGGQRFVAGFFVIDISNPAHPAEVGQLPFGIGNLATERQSAFGISSSGSLEVFSITNPALPSVIGAFNSYPTTNPFSLPLRISGYDVHVVNDLAYMAGYSGTNSQFFVVDVRDATQPIPVGFYTDASQPTALAVDGNYVYLVGPGSPLEILKTPFNTNPVAAPVLSIPAQPGFALSIQGQHGRHYDVLYSDSLTGGSWQTLETLLLTNDTAVIAPPSGTATRFFRLKQDD